MNILVRGSKDRIQEIEEKLKLNEISLQMLAESDSLPEDLSAFSAVFDLNFDDRLDKASAYESYTGILVVSAVKIQLAAVFASTCKATVIGMNCLPGFINRSETEWSLLNEEDKSAAIAFATKLGWSVRFCQDRVGMVSARVLFMLINEACYTLQEGTAGMKDIDTAMKLGTNYPKGPFEWADLIGIKNVYETLDALFTDTREERYKICSLLKTHYLKSKSFYTTE